MRRPTLALTAALAVVAAPVAVAAEPEATSTAATRKTVVVADYEFTPATARVARGGLVTWKFREGRVSHDVTGSGGIRSGTRKETLDDGRDVYRKRFRTRGTFRYVCSIHPSMRGKVVVE